MITQSNYLDIGNLLINELIGSVWLFLAISLIVIIYFSIKHSFDLKTMLALMFLMSMGSVGYYFQQEILVIWGIIIGFSVYLMWSKLVQR